MKKLCLIILILSALLLAACADAQVSYQLDESNEIRIDYAISIPSDDNEALRYIDAIEEYWNEMSFDTDTSREDNKRTLTGKKSIASLSKQDAADTFAALLTDDNALFYDVTFDYVPDLREDHYSLEASVSLEDIIRQSEVQNVPPNEIRALEENASSGTYALSIGLPGDIETTNADEIDDQVCTWHLQYGEATQISLETIHVNQENIAKYEGLEDDLAKDKTWMSVCIAAGAALVLAIILMLIVRRVKSSS